MRAGLPSRRTVLTQGGLAAASVVLGAPRARAASKAAIRLKLGNDVPVGHSVNVRLKEAIAAIHAEAQGAIQIDLFPNNQLGGDPSMLSQIRSGALELTLFPEMVFSTFIPSMGIPGIGFAFTGYDKVWASMDGDLGNYLRAKMREAGLRPFEAVWDNGFRQITTSTKPILTPADLQNFKIRVPVVPMWVSMFRYLGAAPVSIPLNEAYSSLQTKIADGQENPLALINSTKFYEVQKYCSLTNHAWNGFWLVANARMWEGLPADIQALLSKHLNAAALKQREDIAQANITLRKDLEGKGLTFVAPDQLAFRDALRRTGFYGKWKERYGAEAWDHLLKYSGDLE